MSAHTGKNVSHDSSLYARWGIMSYEEDTTEYTRLLQLLAIAEKHIPENVCRVVPTSFDPYDVNLSAFPRPIQWTWNSCADALRVAGVRAGVMMRLPLFWQVESYVHAVCRSLGVPIFVNEPENMPVGRAVLGEGAVDAVITDAEDARSFKLFLLEKNSVCPVWFIIHKVGAPAWDLPMTLVESREKIHQEVHLFPGVPLLEQCEALSAQKEPLFHFSSSYTVEEGEGGHMYISSQGQSDPFPLRRYVLPVSLVGREVCVCGKTIISRVN